MVLLVFFYFSRLIQKKSKPTTNGYSINVDTGCVCLLCGIITVTFRTELNFIKRLYNEVYEQSIGLLNASEVLLLKSISAQILSWIRSQLGRLLQGIVQRV